VSAAVFGTISRSFIAAILMAAIFLRN